MVSVARVSAWVVVGLLAWAPMAVPQTEAPIHGEKPAGEKIERRIGDLHRRLRITQAQQAAWEAFAQVMRDNAGRMALVFQGGGGQPLSAVDDMRLYAKLSQEHADDVQRLLPPFETLYAAMAAEQRKTADGIFRDFQRREAARSDRE